MSAVLIAVAVYNPEWGIHAAISSPVYGNGVYGLGNIGGTPMGSAAQVGQVLFTTYVLPFQLIGVLLLAAMVGAVVLVHEKPRKLPAGRGLSAMQERAKREGAEPEEEARA